jgi:uncharacterized protein YjbI with pentapeptide repeats
MECTLLAEASLLGADLRGAHLRGAAFPGAVLQGARFGGAALFGCDLRGANLRGARELTPNQLAQARTDHSTILPDGASGPYMKNCGHERAARAY